ncbi:hypothetical protein BLNAU_12204 [Blattamonas nauphoetae]|uniref:ISXO2-like transposase domain-containing protein n=1 Tax=Blattamonas nauphoetae TaxID=2049346 RepID=A0ABQ9XKC6_9EUKA|nr:hypothetical protein BLNAU_12204 [Blattamonas nauphoetae]
MFLERVANRDAQTLLDILQKHIAPGSTVVTDGWAGYHGIESLGTNHQVVIYKRNEWVNKEGFTTNNIEASWRRLRQCLPSNGVPRWSLTMVEMAVLEKSKLKDVQDKRRKTRKWQHISKRQRHLAGANKRGKKKLVDRSKKDTQKKKRLPRLRQERGTARTLYGPSQTYYSPHSRQMFKVSEFNQNTTRTSLKKRRS